MNPTSSSRNHEIHFTQFVRIPHMGLALRMLNISYSPKLQGLVAFQSYRAERARERERERERAIQRVKMGNLSFIGLCDNSIVVFYL